MWNNVKYIFGQVGRIKCLLSRILPGFLFPSCVPVPGEKLLWGNEVQDPHCPEVHIFFLKSSENTPGFLPYWRFE